MATSLIASGIYTMGSDLAIQLKIGRVASARPRNNPLNPISNFYRSAEGRWFIHNPRGASGGWAEFCAVAGRPELATDPRFETGRLRRQNAAECCAELEAAFALLPFDEIARRLNEADLVWAPMQTPADVAADPQMDAAGVFVNVEDGNGGTFRSPAAPVSFPGADARQRPPSPKLGEHTRAVLADLGYDEAAIEAMLAAGSAA